MDNDKLIECPRCKYPLAYETKITEDVTQYSCIGCGYYSSNLLIEGSDFYYEQTNSLPELYKDLMFKDEEGKIWFPQIVNLPENGMVFMNGTNAENAQWSAAKAIEILKEDIHKYPIPGQKGKFYSKKMDIEHTLKHFGTNFQAALEYIGVFQED